MKYLLAAAAILTLAACTTPPQYTMGVYLPSGTPGNPNKTTYVGGAGSVYDNGANPPATVGIVTYNPDTPSTSPNDTITGVTTAPAMPAR
jgi:hypothetical protein